MVLLNQYETIVNKANWDTKLKNAEEIIIELCAEGDKQSIISLQKYVQKIVSWDVTRNRIERCLERLLGRKEILQTIATDRNKYYLSPDAPPRVVGSLKADEFFIIPASRISANELTYRGWQMLRYDNIAEVTWVGKNPFTLSRSFRTDWTDEKVFAYLRSLIDK